MPTPDQLRAARALLNLTQGQVSQMTGHTAKTIQRAETPGGATVAPATVSAIRAALESAGVVFLPENGNGPGVALRKD